MKFAIKVSFTLASSAVALVTQINSQTTASNPSHADYTPCDKPKVDPFGKQSVSAECSFKTNQTREILKINYTNDTWSAAIGAWDARVAPFDPEEMQFLIASASKWGHEQKKLSHASDDDALPLTNATSFEPNNGTHPAGLNFLSGDAAFHFAYLPCEPSTEYVANKIPTYGQFQQFLHNFYTLYDTLVIKKNRQDLIGGIGSLDTGFLESITIYSSFKVTNVRDGPYNPYWGFEQCPNEKVVGGEAATVSADAA